MKFVPLRDLLSKTAAVRKALKKEHEMVMTLGGRPIAVLAEVEGKTLAAKLKALRSTRAIMHLDCAQAEARAAGLDKMTMEEIDAEIARARAERAQAQKRPARHR
jgi:hypothetical protein